MGHLARMQTSPAFSFIVAFLFCGSDITVVSFLAITRSSRSPCSSTLFQDEVTKLKRERSSQVCIKSEEIPGYFCPHCSPQTEFLTGILITTDWRISRRTPLRSLSASSCCKWTVPCKIQFHMSSPRFIYNSVTLKFNAMFSFTAINYLNRFWGAVDHEWMHGGNDQFQVWFVDLSIDVLSSWLTDWLSVWSVGWLVGWLNWNRQQY